MKSFFNNAHQYVTANFKGEMDYVECRRFPDMTIHDFFMEYVYVVLNTGMKNQIAEKIFCELKETGDVNVVRHKGKQKAIREATRNCRKWFEELKNAPDKLVYLESLPFIGPITKYHLARNLGLDYAKPDRHLVRLAQKFGCKSVQSMCEELAQISGLRIGTVDVVLWRYCNMQG